MHPESGGPGPADPTPVPRLGIGTIVRHLQFGVGRIVAHEPGQYVIAFRGGDTRRVALSYDALEVEEKRGDPELDRIRQAMREVLGDHGWIDVEIEMAPRWTGGTLRLIPGKAEVQAKDVPIEVFFKKIVAIRDRLRARGLRWTPQRRVLIDVLAVDLGLFDHHLWRRQIAVDMRGIDHDHSVNRRKPDPAIVHFPHDRLHSVLTLHGPQPIGRAEGCACQMGNLSRSDPTQVGVRGRVAHPYGLRGGE
jgi:hypothetical protein